MTLRKRIPDVLAHIKANSEFTSHNACMLEIYEGNLKPYVLAVLQKTLSDNYFQKIKDRTIPINILRRVIDKLSKVYATSPQRTDANYQQFMDDYTKWLKLDERMGVADEYANMFKGYALEPYVHLGKPRLRVIPYDRFMVMSEDKVDPLNPTVFIKFMGKYTKYNGRGKKDCNYYYLYTDEEFLVVDADGDIVESEMGDTNGTNPVGRIPFIYGNRSRIDLIPQPDTDILQMTKMIPVILSDLSGVLMFSCFSIIYGIDIDSENMTMSPNAFWNFKSDPKSEKTPSIGTIKPDADIDVGVNFLASTFAFWLETKGVRVGSIGQLDQGNASSGIAKIIDEMDTFEIRKTNIQFFKNDESNLWILLKDMNNYWVKTKQLAYGIIGDNFEPSIEFDEPKPQVNRVEEVNLVVTQMQAGLLTKEIGLTQLYPDWTQEQLDAALKENVIEIAEEEYEQPKDVRAGVKESFYSKTPPQL